MVDNRIIKVDKIKIVLTLIFLLFTSHNLVFAQISISDRYHSRFLNDIEGLPYRNVDGIFQDDKGFLWISFFGGGIARYDGSRFVTFTKKSSTPISNDFVTESCQDNFGRVWLSSANGIDIIDKNTLKVFPTPYEIQKTTQGNYCNFVMCDEKGRIWYNVWNVIYRASFKDDGSFECLDSLECTNSKAELRLIMKDIDSDGAPYTSIDGQIFKIAGATGIGKLHASFKIANLDIGPNNKATDILRKGSDIWVGTTKGLYRHNQVIGNNDYYLENDYITSLANTTDGVIVAGSLNGINVFDSSNNSFERFGAGGDIFGNTIVSDNMIRCLAMIGEQLWVGTEQEGISILEKKKLSITNIRHRENSFTANQSTPITTVCVDKNGKCWAGASGNGLLLMDDEDFSWTRFDYNDGLSHNSIRSLCCDNDSYLYAGAIGGSLNRVNINTKRIETIIPDGSTLAKSVDNINYLLYDEINNYIWIFARSGLYYYNIIQGSINAFKNSYRLCFGACIDLDYRLWFVHSEGLTSVDLHSMSVNNFTDYGFCHTVCLDSENNLWVGSSEEGVYKLSIRGLVPLEIQHFDIHNGLSDNKIMSLVCNGSYIWCGTEKGLTRINTISSVVESFTKTDGLASDIFNINAVSKGKNEEMYFGHQKGISILWSNYIPSQNETPLRLSFTRALIGQTGINLAYTDEVKFHEKEKLIAFEFADFTYKKNNNINYECRLYPLDKQWRIINQNERYIRWNGVANGDHKLQIRAIDANGNVLPESENELSLSVEPYFFRTPGFTFFFILMLIYCFIYVYRWKTKDIRKRQEEAEHEAELKDQQISEQAHQIELQTEMVNTQEELIIKQNEQIAGHKMIINNETNINVQFAKAITDKLRELYKDPELSIDALCKEMGMSRTVLNSKIQETFGQPIGKFICKYRLSVAKEIIRNNNVNGMNISEIAYDVGFNDPKYFTRCFSREFEMSPSAMMEKYKNQK